MMNQKRIYKKTNTSHYARCRTMMMKFKRMQIVRLILLSVILFSNCYFHVMTLPFFNYEENDPVHGLLWGAFAYGINLVIALIAFCTRTENLKRLVMLLILTVLSTVIGFLHPFAGTAIFILYLTQLPECMKMRWIQEQQGYPYFNERYQLHEDYKAFTKQYIEEADAPSEKSSIPEIVVFSMPEQRKQHR